MRNLPPLHAVQLRRPGHFLPPGYDDIEDLIGVLEHAVVEATIALSLFEESGSDVYAYREAKQNAFMEQSRGPRRPSVAAPEILAGGWPGHYLEHLRYMYARVFLVAADTVGKVLQELKDDTRAPNAAAEVDRFERDLPGLRSLRDTFAHQEDRARGRVRKKEMNLKPIEAAGISSPGGVLVLGLLNGTRFSATVEDGSLREVDISAESLKIVCDAAQRVLDDLPWDDKSRWAGSSAPKRAE